MLGYLAVRSCVQSGNRSVHVNVWRHTIGETTRRDGQPSLDSVIDHLDALAALALTFDP